jgi:RNA polymerase sigma-70 factor, ECF subfamily
MQRGDSGESRRVDFESAALPHLEHLYGAAFYLCADRDRASDLVQETMLRAFRFFHQFEPGTNCRAWLLTILHNTFRNLYRSGRRERAQVDIDEPATAREASEASGVNENPETLVLGDLMDDEVVQALGELPEDFRAAIVLVDLEELTYEEGARALGCPVGTVRSRLSRGRRLLAEKLAAYARERGLLRQRR